MMDQINFLYSLSEVEQAANGTYILHWLVSEEVAIARYGSRWADYVIDIEPTIFNRYTVGSDSTVLENAITDAMKTREHLSFLVNSDIDRDGLSASFEAAIGTNPLKADTDGDGYNDGLEVSTGHDPLH